MGFQLRFFQRRALVDKLGKLNLFWNVSGVGIPQFDSPASE
jgi:hypothetical protein